VEKDKADGGWWKSQENHVPSKAALSLLEPDTCMLAAAKPVYVLEREDN
jgi:hypothetical protein